MPQYAVLAKYSATALTAICGAGYVTRIDQMKNFCESLGGSFVSVGFCGSGSYDFIGIVDIPNDGPFAMSSLGYASGAFDRIEWHELRSAEQMDSLVAAQVNWQPPA